MNESPTFLFFVIAAIVWLVVLLLWMIPVRRKERQQFAAPEDTDSMFRVLFENETVTCIRPDGTVESFSFHRLKRVEILTTEDGPFLPDVFWVFHDSSGSGAVIPDGAEGFQEVMERVLDLEGFDFNRFIESQGCTSHAVFPVWEQSSPDISKI
ncbi:MAG: hypothetical protein CMO55_04715 [Verrucomicrobiales bacterium]|nr:hypothetical protein [Verrucomicrobiales bacterium]